VLLYHRVGRRTDATVDLPVELFARQMEALAGTARVVSLDQALDLLAQPEPPPERVLAVTFDDGSADFTEVALPVLVRHRLPVTLYVATDFVERGVRFPKGEPPASWSSLGDAVSTGLVTIGSHTHTHRLLDRAPPEEARDELTRSSRLIEDRLGVPAEHFAYPKAVLGSPAAEEAVRGRFRSAALAGTKVNPCGATDPYRLARSPIQVGDGMRWFRRKADGGMALEDQLRQLANRRRYSGATT
jgi:peptidoglycan/xylan/chitin deacetylase (PgdA/CDA1 family)